MFETDFLCQVPVLHIFALKFIFVIITTLCIVESVCRAFEVVIPLCNQLLCDSWLTNFLHISFDKTNYNSSYSPLQFDPERWPCTIVKGESSEIRY